MKNYKMLALSIIPNILCDTFLSLMNYKFFEQENISYSPVVFLYKTSPNIKNIELPGLTQVTASDPLLFIK